MMGIFNYFKKFDDMHFLILIGKTGSSSRFAKKTGSSHRQLLENIEKLKEMGAPIIFSEAMESYYYEADWQPYVNRLTTE